MGQSGGTNSAQAEIVAGAEVRRLPGERRLWWLLLSGPVIYSLHFLTVYFLVEAACQTALLHGAILGLNAIAFWVLVLTGLAALLTAATGGWAWQRWRQLRSDHTGRAQLSPAMLTFVGLWLNAFFTLAIVVTGLPVLWLVPCDWI